jgi:hypothetical protein
MNWRGEGRTWAYIQLSFMSTATKNEDHIRVGEKVPIGGPAVRHFVLFYDQNIREQKMYERRETTVFESVKRESQIGE